MAFGEGWRAMTSNTVQSLQDAFGVENIEDTTDPEIIRHIHEARAMYYNKYIPQGCNSGNYNSSLRLPFVIVNKLKKTVFGEYKSDVDGEGELAEKVKQLQEALDKKKGEAFQQGAICGECLIKPIVKKDKIVFSVLHRPCYVVLGRDDEGNATGHGTIETTTEGGYTYLLMERRTVNDDGYLIIECKLYRSKDKFTSISAFKGEQVALATLHKYAHLQPVFVSPIPVGNTGLIPFRIPNENSVTDTPDAVSVFAAAIDVIHELNQLEAAFKKEFKHAASRIIALYDMLKSTPNGEKVLADDLFIGLGNAGQRLGEGSDLTIFSPEIRHVSYLARKNDYLRMIETIIGFQRGILSEVEAVERTATQITDSAGDYNLTIIDLYGAWALADIESIATAVIIGQIYLGWPQGDYPEPALDFGDGVLFDRNKTFSEYMQLVASGALKQEILVAWYFNRKPKNNKEWQALREEYMPDLSEEEAPREGEDNEQ